MPSQLAYLKLSWCSGASYAPALYEPDWRSGKAVATRITKADGRPMRIAGLWSVWKGPVGEVHSFTRLTVNATEQALELRLLHLEIDTISSVSG